MAVGLLHQDIAAAPAQRQHALIERLPLDVHHVRALDDEAFREQLTKVGFPPQRPRNAAAIKEFVDADRARWSAIIRTLNISLD